jgi:hypothetical protein
MKNTRAQFKGSENFIVLHNDRSSAKKMKINPANKTAMITKANNRAKLLRFNLISPDAASISQ